jgi:hypothetical protein
MDDITITYPASQSHDEDPNLLIATDRGLELPATVRARELCAQHIAKFYPDWKQLNILRVGTKVQKDQMTAFIDACRDWSNAEKPNPADLATIAP